MRKKVELAEIAPHSWCIEDWPPGVYPGSVSRGRYIVRAHRDELMAAGALARVGRELVVMGGRYAAWLERRAAKVPGYEVAANRASSPAAA